MIGFSFSCIYVKYSGSFPEPVLIDNDYKWSASEFIILNICWIVWLAFIVILFILNFIFNCIQKTLNNIQGDKRKEVNNERDFF